jgi:penicillin-binding protein A
VTAPSSYGRGGQARSTHGGSGEARDARSWGGGSRGVRDPGGGTWSTRSGGSERRRALRRRALPVIALAALAFLVGAILGAAHSSPSPARALAARFAAAWARGNYASMYGEIAPSSQREVSASEFAGDYREALMTATASGERVTGAPRGAAGGVEMVPVRVRTRLFGVVSESFALPIVSGPGEGDRSEIGLRVAWSPSLAFPGLRPGELLHRRTTLPPRAALLARDGSVLADGPASAAGARSSPLGAAASAVVGEVGPIPASSRQALEAQGVPANAIVGVSGLELAQDERLRGTPGGVLFAGPANPAAAGGAERVLARASPHAGSAVRTTISPAVQSAAVAALGGQYGGVIALEPASGQILGVAGIGLEALQPPGSTFKMITVSGVLGAGIATPQSTFPYETAATLDGVQLHNANGEECGGSLVEAFAVSCNSVFAPLGVKLGAARLVATAERFGFNQPPGVPGAAESTIPEASDIQGELAVGSTAIGQDQVLATPLEMATVAATIADGGRRPAPSLTASAGTAGEGGSAGGEGRSAGGAAGAAAPTGTRAISAATARTVRGLMIDVVRFGTGTAAAIPGVVVAGKTGTAELGTPSTQSAGSPCGSSDSEPEQKPADAEAHTSGEHASEANCAAEQTEQSNPRNTDAWFAAFAPALHPRIAVGVLMVRDGAGGATAAPVARQVIEAALQAGG